MNSGDMMTRMMKFALAATVFLAGAGEVRAAAPCADDMAFGPWLDGVRAEAAAQGVSQGTIAAALGGATFDQSIVARDRRQSVFSQTFLEFAGRMVNQNRLDHGANNLRKYASTFARIEQQWGVPGPVLAAFWGLETDYGANIGDLPTINSLVAMAYDCRRPERFRGELIAALKIIERGDLSAHEMVGPWAGELGQLQFLPSHYLTYAVDFDGDGRRDLLHTSPDALASAANYMASIGWRPGEPWLEEVRVPSNLAWQEADIAITHPRTQWAQWGVTRPGGQPLAQDALPASLLLPMGRNGPAFLAYPNFHVFLEWNESLIYATTVAYFATRLAGAPRVGNGNGQVAALGYNEIKQLQELLVRRGYDVGGVDGKLGEMTRAAVKAAQLELGLPADSYPTPDLVARLR
jgi:lytic murein transglycosylase